MDGGRPHDFWFTTSRPCHLATTPVRACRATRFNTPFPVVTSRWRQRFIHFLLRQSLVTTRSTDSWSFLHLQRNSSLCERKESRLWEEGRGQGVVNFPRAPAVFHWHRFRFSATHNSTNWKRFQNQRFITSPDPTPLSAPYMGVKLA